MLETLCPKKKKQEQIEAFQLQTKDSKQKGLPILRNKESSRNPLVKKLFTPWEKFPWTDDRKLETFCMLCILLHLLKN